MYRSFVLASLAVTATFPVSAFAQQKPKQLVIVSFDGAGDNSLWERSRATAKETGAHFTYFLSCTLIMDPATGKSYEGPGQKPGRSNVGFGQSVEEVQARLTNVWQAHLEGHDIASHACGHFDGKDWTASDWDAEFSTFTTTLTNAWASIGKKDQQPAGWEDFARNGIKGFRAPYLSLSDNVLAAEKKHGFVYDASTVTRGPQWPTRTEGILHFGLPLIPEGPQSRRIIAMDYNLFVRHSVAIETPSKSAEFEERSYAAFRAAFDKEYRGERIALQLGFHFVKMNGGAYWNAYERLLREVCKLEDVACVSYAQAVPLIAERRKTEKADGSAF